MVSLCLRHSYFDCAWLSWLFSPSTSGCSGAVAANADQIIPYGSVWLFAAILLLQLGWVSLDRAPYIA